MKTDLDTNLRVLEDNGFCDYQSRNIPPGHIQRYVENLLDDAA